MWVGLCLAGYSAPPAVLGQASESALSGKLTLDHVNWISHDRVAVIEITLPDVQMRRLAPGGFPWRHPDGEFISAQGCGAGANRLVISDEAGRTRIVSPCSSELEEPAARKPRFEFSRISPDKRYVAAEVAYLTDTPRMDWAYSTIVLEDGDVISYFPGFVAPEWLPDGRLLLAGEGMYVTDIRGEPTRLDDGSLTVGVNNMDLHPSGKMIAFEWNQRLWVINSDGSAYKEIMTGPEWYRFPAWSPDGNHLAFLATSGSSDSEVQSAILILDIRNGEVQSIDLSPFGGTLGHRPGGPLSWTR